MANTTNPRRPARQEPSSLYSGINLRGTREVRKKETPLPMQAYERFTRSMSKVFSGFGKGAKFTETQLAAIDFMQSDLSAPEIYSVANGLRILFVAFGIAAAGLVYFSIPFVDITMVLAALGIFAGLGFAIQYIYVNYAVSQAENERKQSLAYIPEIVNYLIMNMRLTPNLEKAVDFAATHGRGKIAADMRKLVWDVQIGKFNSIEEGLDDLAYRWGAYSDDFKHSLMLIRASLLEGDAKRREELLDKASADVIEGSKEKMDLYARQLHQPTVYLYYFGILLPLMLAIILPIASSMMPNFPIAGILPFFLIYDVFLPIGMYVLAKTILSGRPPTYVAPEIPEDFPGLPPRGTVKLGGVPIPVAPLALLVLVACLSVGVTLDAANIAAINSSFAISDKATAISALAHFDLPFSLPFVGTAIYIFTIYGLLVGASLALSIYLYGTYSARKKVQDEIRAMETEFKDALYVLASRLGENRPIEDALRNAVEFLPRSQVSNKISAESWTTSRRWA